MEYHNDLKQKLSILCDYIDRMSPDSDGFQLIDKDIIMEKIRTIYSFVNDIPVINQPYIHNETTETAVNEQASVEAKLPIDSSAEVGNQPTTTIPPIFAPDELQDKVESVAEPVMTEVEKDDYDDLFDNKPLTEPEHTAIADNESQPATATLPTEEPVSDQIPAIPDEGATTTNIVEKITETEETSPIPEKVSAVTETTEIPENYGAKGETLNAQPTVQNDTSQKSPQSEPSLFDYLSKSPDSKHTQTIGDKFEQEHASIGDNISQKTASHKVTDLRTVININDKFSFVSALFHNNMRAYTDFILRLNAIDNRDEAINYISEIAQQYSWNMDSIEVKTFNKILDRKF